MVDAVLPFRSRILLACDIAVSVIDLVFGCISVWVLLIGILITCNIAN